MTPQLVARGYFGVQAAAGAGWWIGVFLSEDVRRWTLGGLDARLLVGPDLALFVGASLAVAVSANRVAVALATGWTIAVTVALTGYGLLERSAGWGVVAMVAASASTLLAAAVLWFGRLPTRWFFVGPFAFRVAPEATGGRHLRRSLGQLVVFWTTFFLIVPTALAAVEDRLRLGWPVLDHPAVVIAGVVAFTLGSAGGLWSCVTMALQGEGTPLPAETARRLVVAGPYRIVRNPMAVAGGVQTASIGLVYGSWTVIVISVAGAVAWNQIVRPAEESDLAARFGGDYQHYCAAVRCWVPTRGLL